MKDMKIVGQINTPEEAKEIESITKSFVVACHSRMLASQIRGE